MSQKFSFVIEVKGDKPVGYAFKKEEAQSAKDLFNKLREEGKEAYIFQHPNHDKRCKSTEQKEASKGTEGGEQPARLADLPKPVEDVVIEQPKQEKVRGKNSIFGL
jgi:hypothetical protein